MIIYLVPSRVGSLGRIHTPRSSASYAYDGAENSDDGDGTKTAVGEDTALLRMKYTQAFRTCLWFCHKLSMQMVINLIYIRKIQLKIMAARKWNLLKKTFLVKTPT